MSDTVEKLHTVYHNWLDDEAKFADGNKAAGTRARKALMEMTKLAKLRRKEITDIKNG